MDGRDCAGDYRGYQKTVGCRQGLRGGTQTAGNWKDSRARVDKNDGNRRGRPGMGNDGRGWVMIAEAEQ